VRIIDESFAEYEPPHIIEAPKEQPIEPPAPPAVNGHRGLAGLSSNRGPRHRRLFARRVRDARVWRRVYANRKRIERIARCRGPCDLVFMPP
jgi:hypothetical protein